MYNCLVKIYLSGENCPAFDVIRTVCAPEKFSFDFFEGGFPKAGKTCAGDVIIAGMTGEGVSDFLEAVSRKDFKDCTVILMGSREDIPLTDNIMENINDIWFTPLSEAEVRFRFGRLCEELRKSAESSLTAQYLDRTINTIPVLIWYKDKHGIHHKVNDEFCRTVGKPREQVEGREHAYIWNVSPDDPGVEECARSDRLVMECGDTVIGEETVQAGSETLLMTTYKSPLYERDGSVMGTVGVGIDITRERAYQKELLAKSRTLENIFSAVDCGILCHSLDGSKLMSINREALKILGYSSEEEIIADGFQMLSPSVIAEDREKLQKAISSLKEVGDSASMEYRVRHKDGKLVHVTGNVKLLEENGQMYYQRFLLDVTEQKKLENEINRQQAELIQAISIDYSMVSFVDLGADTYRLLRIFKESEAVYKTCFKNNPSFSHGISNYIDNFVAEEDRAALRDAFSIRGLRRELSDKQIFYVQYRRINGGETQYYELKAVKSGIWEQGENGSPAEGVVIGFRSVDKETRKKLEEQKLLENALQQAEHASAAKSIFLSNMSHDIRTPMNAIIGFSGLAMTHIDEKERVKQYLEKIMTSGRHLLSLINDVLDMSRIENGRLIPEESVCSLTEILSDLSDIMTEDIAAKGIFYTVDTSKLLHQRIYCDRLRLNQVLLNIVSNAVKYTEPGGQVTLTVNEHQSDPGRVEYKFIVKDTGIGMSDEFLAHLFELFSRERNTTASGIQGTGLGMAITKNIVEMMGGRIDVKSKQGKGTTVSIIFSFRTAGKAPDVLPIDRKAVVKAMPTGRILLTEDNELNQEIASDLLTDAGFEVDIADNGRIAVEKLVTAPAGYYRLILMDVQMPVMNGYEATKAIRALPDKARAEIPIIAMTANAFEEDKQEALRCGVNGHIPKPVDVQVLMSTIEEILK